MRADAIDDAASYAGPAPPGGCDAAGAGGRRALALFALIAFGWTWGLWGASAMIGRDASGFRATLLIASAFGPGVAACVTVRASEGPVGFRRWMRRCLGWRFGWGWLPLVLVAPALVMAIALGLHVVSGGTMPSSAAWNAPAATLLAGLVIGIVLGGPLGEEFGWRGYALPRLTERFGWRAASGIVGVAWAIWHLPLFWMDGMVQAALPVWPFLASTVALSVIFARVSVNTGFSVLPAIALHGAINWSSGILPVLPNGDTRPYAITVGLVILVAIASILWLGPHKSVEGHTGATT